MKVLSIIGIVINAFLLLALLGTVDDHSRAGFEDLIGIGVVAVIFSLALSIVGTCSKNRVV